MKLNQAFLLVLLLANFAFFSVGAGSICSTGLHAVLAPLKNYAPAEAYCSWKYPLTPVTAASTGPRSTFTSVITSITTTTTSFSSAGPPEKWNIRGRLGTQTSKLDPRVSVFCITSVGKRFCFDHLFLHWNSTNYNGKYLIRQERGRGWSEQTDYYCTCPDDDHHYHHYGYHLHFHLILKCSTA